MLSQVRALLTLIVAIVITAVAAILTGIGGGGTGPSPTTTTSSSSTSTSASSSTTSSIPGSTTTAPGSTTTAPGSTTTTTAPPIPGEEPTDYTRIRLIVDNSAAWFTFTLTDVQIRATRVVSTTGTFRFTSTGPSISVDGNGQGVLDLVLAITEDANPQLRSCKNWVGSAHVDVHRMTDGDVSVASLNNTGNSPTPATCENPANTTVARSALIGTTRWPGRADPRRLVLAAYYPWYDPTDLQRDFGDNPTGPADTTSPAVVADAVELAADSGIDGFLVEWEAVPAEDPRIDAVFDAAANHGDFEAALILDFEILYGRDGNVSPGDLNGALAAVAARANEPAQLEVGGQPVVFLYGTARVNVAQWQAALSQLMTNTGLQPFFVDQLDRLSAQGNYTYGSQTLADRAALFSYADSQLQARRLQPGLTGQAPRLWVHPVQPGYDDSRLGRANPSVVSRNGGQRYEDAWEAALVSLPDWIFVSTWNEFFEQTHVLQGDQTGDTALETTAEWAAIFHAGG